jgi:hypothetical protein
MVIAQCDNCGQTRPGHKCDIFGVEGFFCWICHGDELDPYGELEEEVIVPCIDGTEKHEWVVSGEDENICYCSRCGSMEY